MEITDLEIDDDNELHATRHGVSITEMHQVFTNGPTIRRNHRAERPPTSPSVERTVAAGWSSRLSG